MTTLRRFLTGTAVLVLASASIVSASIIDSIQTATGGTLPAMGSGNTPPPPNTGTASVSAFDPIAANNAIQASCPTGFTCSGPTLFEIDLGLTASLSGSLNLTNNTSGTLAIPCISGLGQCDTSSSTNGNGVSVEGLANLVINDPNMNNVGPGNLATFLQSTNMIGTDACTGNSHNNCLVIGTGTTPLSGSNSVSDPLSELYQISDSNWLIESAPYNTPNTSVGFGLSLSSQVTIGQPEPGGLGSNSNMALLNSGAIDVQYQYEYSETLTSTTPEPTTFFLLGSALVGLGLAGKRFKKS